MPSNVSRLAIGSSEGSHGQLRGVGLSGQKVGYLRDLCARIGDGRLLLDELELLNDELVIERLTSVKGFGRWTADAAHGGQRLDDLLVGAAAEGSEIESARGDLAPETHDVLRLERRELHSAQLGHPRPSQPLRLGKSVDGMPAHLDCRAESAHEPGLDREGE